MGPVATLCHLLNVCVLEVRVSVQPFIACFWRRRLGGGWDGTDGCGECRKTFDHCLEFYDVRIKNIEF